MKENDTSLFKGHRARMRAKLQSYGTRYFETYELLEMLLYSVFTRKNTHPTAKLLLKEFSSLENLFSADAESLTALSGVGDECAKFIMSVGSFLNFKDSSTNAGRTFSSYEEIGEFFADYFKEKSESETAILLLDANLSYLDFSVVYPFDLSSGAVQAKPFIDAALKCGASVCVIAHNHPHSSPFPPDGDWETSKLLKGALESAGIRLLECFVVTKEGYKRFLGDKINRTDMLKNNENDTKTADTSTLFSYLDEIFKLCNKDFSELATKLVGVFKTKRELFESDYKKLESLTKSSAAAELILIIAALAARRETESFKFKKTHSEEEIKAFLKGFYLNASRESVAILPLDESGKILAIELLSDGTVNASNVIPRAILEKLSSYGARSFIMAHNHPNGAAMPSPEDIEASAALAAALKSSGIHLVSHYVVGNGECNKIDFLEN